MITLDTGDSSPRAKCLAVVAFVVLEAILLGTSSASAQTVAPVQAQPANPYTASAILAEASKPSDLLFANTNACLVTALKAMKPNQARKFCLDTAKLTVKLATEMANEAADSTKNNRQQVVAPPFYSGGGGNYGYAGGGFPCRNQGTWVGNNYIPPPPCEVKPVVQGNVFQ